MVATADLLCKGRWIVSFGVGWPNPSFKPTAFGTKILYALKFMERLRLILNLRTEDRVSFDGRYYKAKGTFFDSKSIQKLYLLIWFGATQTIC